MDQEKIDYFVARYGGLGEEEICELLARKDSLAEEAQLALVRVASARSIVLSKQDADRIRSEQLASLPASTIEENSFTLEAARVVHERKVLLLWSIPIGMVLGVVYRLYMPILGGTIPLPALVAAAVFSVAWPLLCLFRLSTSIDPSRSVAWTMVGMQLIPIFGWISAISLILKASRIWEAAKTK